MPFAQRGRVSQEPSPRHPRGRRYRALTRLAAVSLAGPVVIGVVALTATNGWAEVPAAECRPTPGSDVPERVPAEVFDGSVDDGAVAEVATPAVFLERNARSGVLPRTGAADLALVGFGFGCLVCGGILGFIRACTLAGAAEDS